MATTPVKLGTEKTMQDLLAALNLDPAMLAGFNTDYLGQSNNLYQQLAAQYAGLDTEQGYAEADYLRGIQENVANQARAKLALKDRLASRGMLDSTPGQDQISQLDRQYETLGRDLGTTRDRASANITGRRGAFDNDYAIAMDMLNSGLRKQAQDYVKTKGDEETARAGKQHDSDILDALNNITVSGINQQIPAYTPPAIDMSALTAYLANRPVAPTPAPAPPVAPKPPSVNNPYLSDPFGTQGKNPTYGTGGANSFTGGGGTAYNTQKRPAITGKPGTYAKR